MKYGDLPKSKVTGAFLETLVQEGIHSDKLKECRLNIEVTKVNAEPYSLSARSAVFTVYVTNKAGEVVACLVEDAEVGELCTLSILDLASPFVVKLSGG